MGKLEGVMGYFEGKVFLVTGASSGIGRAIAELLVARGARVVAMARTADQLESLRQAVKTPGHLAPFPGDVTDEHACRGAVEAAVERFGKLDGLIHSAGISMRGLVAETKLEVYRRLMEVNYYSSIALIQAALPAVQATKGHLVVISSVVGKLSTPYRSGYAASKHAVQALLDALRVEQTDAGVHVLAVCPGFVKTNISYSALTASGEAHNQMDKDTAGGLEAEDVAVQVLEAIEQRMREIFPAQRLEKLALFLKRYSPAMLDKVLLKRLRDPSQGY
jgi:short-subunit dehydrogenase